MASRRSCEAGSAGKSGGGFNMFGKARSSVRNLRKNNNAAASTSRQNGNNATKEPAAMPSSADGQQPQQQVPMSRSTPNLQQLVNSLYLRDDPAWGAPAAALAAGHNTHQQHHSPLQQLQPAAPSRSESVTSLPASSSSGLSSWGSIQDASKAGWEQVPTPPVRDASSSLQAMRYGQGHEKFPSWPVPAATDQMPIAKQCCHNIGVTQRSRLWSDQQQQQQQNDYPRDVDGSYYTRPYLRRQASSGNTLKTVLERSEAGIMFAKPLTAEQIHHQSLPSLDREGQSIGDLRYLAPSPPERDIPGQKAEPQVHHLTQAEVEKYASTYDAALLRQQSVELFGCCPAPVHQSQGSYAQSEGYHSYVSSTDSTNTPFMDRLRQDAHHSSGHSHEHQASLASSGFAWDEGDAVTSNNSSGDVVWRGSLSDMSVASGPVAGGMHSMNAKQLIAHSSRVQTPQRHMSESVLLLSSQQNHPNNPSSGHWPSRSIRNFNQSTGNISSSNLSVADRISELEKHSFSSSTSSLSMKIMPQTKQGVCPIDPSNLKAVQKQALLSFYERQQQQQQQQQNWKSEPYLAPPPAPPRSAAVEAWRPEQIDEFEKNSRTDSLRRTARSVSVSEPPHQKLPSPSSEMSSDLLGPLLMGAPIMLDDWPPERPPKKPHMRPAAHRPPQPSRMPPESRCSPEPPPPPSPPLAEGGLFCDNALPPPPPNIDTVCTESSKGAPPYGRNADAGVEGSYKRTSETGMSVAATTVTVGPTKSSIASSVAVGVAAQSSTRLNRSLLMRQPFKDSLATAATHINNNNNNKHSLNNNNNANTIKSGLDSVAWNLNSALLLDRPQQLFHLPKTPKPSKPIDAASDDSAMPLANRSLKPVPPQLSLPAVPTLSKNDESHPSTTTPDEASIMTELPESSSNQPHRAAITPISGSNEEEEEYVQLTRDLASQLSPTDRLQVLLAQNEKIKSTDFVGGLFQMRPLSRLSSRASASLSSKSPSPQLPMLSPKHNEQNTSGSESLPSNSAYFTISESKAMFLTRYSKDIICSNQPVSEDLQHRKEELVGRLTKKLEILREEQTVMAMEVKINEQLGVGLQDRLKEACRHQEAAKLALHVDEVGKITSLLLGLSGRLARVENALYGLHSESSSEEKDALVFKREKLTSQLTEAKYLKDCIDKRSAQLTKMLAKILDEEAATDFEHFVCMKASLQVGARELVDRIGLGEEQLAALKETLST